MNRKRQNLRTKLAFSLTVLGALVWIFVGTIVSTTVPLAVAMLLRSGSGGHSETLFLGSICLLMIATWIFVLWRIQVVCEDTLRIHGLSAAKWSLTIPFVNIVVVHRTLAKCDRQLD